MCKRIAFFLCFSLMSFCATAQKDFEYVDSSLLYDKDQTVETAPETENETEKDFSSDTTVNIRAYSISADTLNAWKAKKDFAWAKNLDSLLKEEQRKATSTYTYRKPSGTNSFFAKLFNSGLFKLILWLIAGTVVAFILYNLFISKGAFKRRSKSMVATVAATEDELYLQKDFGALIHESCKQGDYRAATRYLFLRTLQQLSDKSYINFAIDKTNHKYVYEVPENKREAFATLIMNYEYIWYGNINIDKELYTKIETKFSSFSKTIL